MKLLNDLLAILPEGNVLQVCIGLHWTAVVVEVGGKVRCGLASTLRENDEHHGEPDVPQAGQLTTMSGMHLASLVQSERPTLVSVGMAAINALLPRRPETWVEMNAEEVIASEGADKQVVLVGHFPFIPRLRGRVGKLIVLENNPKPGDLPASTAQEVIPSAEVVAITGMTLLNHTLEGLLHLCDPSATVILLGPSTPLSPVLFEYGVDWLSGAVVEDIDTVVRAVGQGGNFRQIHRAGTRLVNMNRSMTGHKDALQR
jgi:hypothetical protein